MDLSFSLSSDLFNLMCLPLILLTLIDVLPRWKRIWDDDLSSEDRRSIMRIVIFLALPVVVLIHELGHMFAALSMGVKVYEFHYGPVTGFVKVDSNIAPEKLLWIAVAGNLAQICLGLFSLLFAALTRRAALTVFFVYLGLFAIAETVIFYAALSFASFYGDWIQIYSSPCRDIVQFVAVAHAACVLFIFYCLCAGAPRIWFSRVTMPGWSSRQRILQDLSAREPSVKSYLDLADVYAEAGLFREAENALKKAEAIEPGNLFIDYSRAQIEISRGNVDKGLSAFEKLVSDKRLSNIFRAHVLLQMGEIWLFRRVIEKALSCFDDASVLDPQLGDQNPKTPSKELID